MTGIIAVPKRTTRATEEATSSSSTSATPPTAATAAAPQMEKPHVLSRRWPGATLSNRPSPRVRTMPPETIPTTTTTIRQPRPAMSVRASWKPSRATPTRSQRFAATASPARRLGATPAVLARTAPAAMAKSSGLTDGSHWDTSSDAVAAPAATPSPGSRWVRCVRTRSHP